MLRFSLFMPTTQPRLTITLDRDLSIRLDRAAAAARTSRASVARQCLAASLPFVGTKLPLDGLSESQIAEFHELLGQALEATFQSIKSEITSADSDSSEGTGAGNPTAPTPVTSNTGVRT